MTPLEARQYLDSFINHEIHMDQIKLKEFKLERVNVLLKALGDPHKNLKVIHVAGSKGKGSICVLTSSVLRAAGYKVGLYTSPHIYNYRERIRVLGVPRPGRHTEDIFPDAISEEELGNVLDEVKPAIEQVRCQTRWGALSFFEIYTALAVYYFHKMKVDCAVLETGVGGRLDATNAVPSMVAAIAPISLDHTHILGATISLIAKEKAAIIKSHGQKVVIAPQDNEASKVLEDRCRQWDIDAFWAGRHVQVQLLTQTIDRQIFTMVTPNAVYERCAMPLLGKHQRDNAAVVAGIVESLRDLGFRISTDALRQGFKNVFWPGRFEVIKKDPLVILDGAHNGASAQMLAQTIRTLFGDKKAILILGVSKDKDKDAIYEALSGIAKDIIYTKANHPRADDLPGAVDPRQALALAYQKAERDDVILVTGSIFVISEARGLLSEARGCIK